MISRITIVTVVKDDRHGLMSTMTSVFQQSRPADEVIIVDGSSTDGSLESARRLADQGVRVLEGPDNGIYDAMNKGLRAATGDYVWYLNAGDTLAGVDAVAAVADFLSITSDDWIYGAALSVDSQGMPCGPVLQPALTRRDLERGTVHVNHQAMLMSRPLLDKLDGFRLKFRLAAEYDLYLRASALTTPVVLPRVLVNFRVGGASFQHRAEHIREMGEARREALNLTGLAAMRNDAITRFLMWRTSSPLSQKPMVRKVRNAYLSRKYGGPARR